MLGKLKKHDKGYSLVVDNIEIAIYDSERQERPLYSLFKINCDEIFSNDILNILTELDVRVLMGGYRLNSDGEKIGFPDFTLPKTDDNNCLILKKIQ